jgi:hypothetical protein
MLSRLRRKGDLFREVLTNKQGLGEAVRKAEALADSRPAARRARA